MTEDRGAQRLRILGAAALVVGAVEVALCFRGPIAFVRKPATMLFPVFSSGLSGADVERVTRWVEREIALSNCYGIANRRLLEDRGHPLDTPIPWAEAWDTARDLGLERFAIAVAFASPGAAEVSVSIRSVFDGETVRSSSRRAAGLEELLADETGALRRELAASTKGLGLTDWLIVALLAAWAVLGVRTVSGREPGLLAEAVAAAGLVLFLFAYIYARAANMDYMQRFAATSGQIQIARSTAVEQLHALLRFGPLLLVDGALLARRARRSGTAVVARWALPLVALSALLFALSFPSFASLDGWGPLAWIALVPLFVVLMTVAPRQGFVYGLVFGALQALLINFWHGTYSYVTLHLVTIGFVVEYAVFTPLLVRAARGRWASAAIAAAWTVFDLARSSGLLAYPWGLIGATQYRFLPLIQIASVTGVWGVGFVVVLCNAAIAQALAAPRGARGRLLPLAAAAATLSATVAAGGVLLAGADAAIREAPARATIVAVQPNTDPRKHAYEENQGRLRALTDERLASLRVPPDLVVWPEGAFSFDIRSWSLPEHREHGWGPMVRQFLDYQRERGIWLLTGTPDYPPGTDEHFNASTLIDPRGRIAPYYHKMQLVPFTEHFPLDKERFSGLYEMFRKLDISDWSVGRERVVFEHERMRLVSMICFEDVFPDHVRRFVLADVDVILNIGNDYWSLSPVEGRQHGVFALFRAVENRRPVLRTTCSGYTVAVDAAGRIQPGAPEPYTAASMLTRVSLAEKRLTLYTRWGDWFPAACGLALLAAAALRLAARLRARWALRAPRTRWRRDGGGAIMGTAYAGTSRADDSLSVTLAAALAGPGCGHGADLS